MTCSCTDCDLVALSARLASLWSMSDLVWYAAYGSNLSGERFGYYLEGGVLPGLPIQHLPCTDPSPPQADRGLLLPHRLFMARHSQGWGGGVAFLHPERDAAQVTYGRAWLLTRAQFAHVVAQENALPSVDIPWGALLAAGQLDICGGWYGRLLVLEAEREGHPVVTCTTSDTGLHGRCAPPSEAYLSTIIAGLIETYALGKQAVVKYCGAIPGVQPRFSKGDIGRLWQQVVDSNQDE